MSDDSDASSSDDQRPMYSAAGRLRRKASIKVDYKALESGELLPSYVEEKEKFAKLVASRRYTSFNVKELRGSELTPQFFAKTGLREPVLIAQKDGLNMKAPPSSFTVKDIVRTVGEDFKVKVIEVGAQREIQGMTLGEWGRYFENKDERQKVLNIISLEFSHTPLARHVSPPRTVQEIDWINRFWPPAHKYPGFYPQVQRYCLMSVGGCFTDFHIDFGGTAVWYHVCNGLKVFYFCPPTEENLKKYETWQRAEDHSSIFFRDLVTECFKLTLYPGQTLLIPTGWIHSVYTPEDSLVFGGNFVHGGDISTMMRVAEIEESSDISADFRMPYFDSLMWYAATHLLDSLRVEQGVKIPAERLEVVRPLTVWEKRGMAALIDRLERWWASVQDRSIALPDFTQRTFAIAYTTCQKFDCATPGKAIEELQERVLALDDVPSDEASSEDGEESRGENEKTKKKVILKLKVSRSQDDKLGGAGTESSSGEQEWKVRCICGVDAKNYDDGWRMIACDQCGVWQHTFCYGIANEAEIPENYLCDKCQPKDDEVTLKISKRRLEEGGSTDESDESSYEDAGYDEDFREKPSRKKKAKAPAAQQSKSQQSTKRKKAKKSSASSARATSSSKEFTRRKSGIASPTASHTQPTVAASSHPSPRAGGGASPRTPLPGSYSIAVNAKKAGKNLTVRQRLQQKLVAHMKGKR